MLSCHYTEDFLNLQGVNIIRQKGNPRFSDKHGIIERLAEMSKPFGTKIRVNEKGFGVVEI